MKNGLKLSRERESSQQEKLEPPLSTSVSWCIPLSLCGCYGVANALYPPTFIEFVTGSICVY